MSFGASVHAGIRVAKERVRAFLRIYMPRGRRTGKGGERERERESEEELVNNNGVVFCAKFAGTSSGSRSQRSPETAIAE